MSEKRKKILLIGKPNCGKSLLFSKLTGLKQKVSNFPGVTVELKRGNYKEFELLDFPGIYTLNSISQDEKIAVQSFYEALDKNKEDVCAVICVADATRFEHSMSLALDVHQKCIEQGVPMMIAMNMMDLIAGHDLKLNVDEISQTLKIPVVGISAKKSMGFDILYSELCQVSQGSVALPNLKKTHKKEVLKNLVEKFAPQTETLLAQQNKVDQWLMSPFFGTVFFLLSMLLIFQSIFSWSEPLMTGVQSLFSFFGTAAKNYLPQGILQDFVREAIIEGFGAFVIFVPQIFVLTFIIGVLEDSGYLARSAIICHRVLSFFGFSGKSFVPLLTGHACAIPAIMAARTIDSPKKRWITMLTVPLTACSARLPVYTLLIVSLIPSQRIFYGLFGMRGLVFFALYAFGIIMALIIGLIIDRFSTAYKKDIYPFILELPPYRMPGLKPLLQKSFRSAWSFLSGAGPMIMMVTVVVWALGYFPNYGESLQDSYLASIGRFFEPIFAPLGIDWRYGVAILASFLAREVFVGTLGTMFGIESADDNIMGLSEKIQNSGFEVASGFALLVFYAIALQCVSTVSILRNELGSRKQAWGIFLFYGILAYLLAFITYQILR